MDRTTRRWLPWDVVQKASIHTRDEDIHVVGADLVVSARGFRALRGVGLEEVVQAAAIPLHGRAIHTTGGSVRFQPYGNNTREDVDRAVDCLQQLCS